jgi:protein OS-9
MTMTDTVLFVKETRTCEYVLVIHTPRLCGEPGFKSRLEQMPETAIRCREIVDDVNSVDPALPEAPNPFKRQVRPPVPVPPPQRPVEDEGGKDKARSSVDRAQDMAKLLRKALESLLGREDIEDMALLEVQPGEQEGEFIFALETDGEQAVAAPEGGEPVARGRGGTLEAALRAAGYDVRPKEPVEDEQSQKKKAARDELWGQAVRLIKTLYS